MLSVPFKLAFAQMSSLSQGTAFTSEQARLMRRFVESVILCSDSDQAGQKAIGGWLPALLECGLEVRVALLPEGEDPD